VFVIIVAALIVAWIVQGTGSVTHRGREGYITWTFAVLYGAALYRFIYDWWLRTPGPKTP